MLAKTSKERLLRLVEFMESLPPEADQHFNMNAYANHDGKGHNHDIPAKPEDLLSCGTTACAMGWMATMPYFRRKGLRIGYAHGQLWTFIGESSQDYNEVAEYLLGLNYDQAETLFACMNNDKTPKEWAKRCRALIEEWDATE